MDPAAAVATRRTTACTYLKVVAVRLQLERHPNTLFIAFERAIARLIYFISCIVYMCIFLVPPLQITQLKIASNPFAKGFRDCDPDDW